ncbi:MAG: DNA gyrase subunit A [Candidatus Kapabacteria bacterium]|jgi:DNA gyrase subunit A|nr:DNA gyrase subunit A [Candidatus Kapabacteria bacterium]
MASSERILPVTMEDEMRNSYLDYSMSVIVARALPDVRDGLKPVHRRILYGMTELGLASNRPYKKSARIVGEVLGKYHPHGDSSVYDAMVRLAQTWSMRYPLVDGQGNFGSMDGDAPAAMRYTEARLASIAGEVLRDIDKNTVDFRPNFDDSLEEPTVMPTNVPLLLVNGAGGIAVGMATNIPPHNLTEIVNGLLALIKKPELTVEELMQHITAPDFPTGGIIYGYQGVRDAYTTGRGRVIVRAKAFIEKAKTGRESIVVTELPFQLNKASLIEKIADLVRDKKLEDIADVRDESDRDGVRVVIDLKRDANSGVVLNNLFKQTQMQSTFGVIMLALVKGRPKILTLKEMLEHFLEFRNEVIVRRTQFDLDAAEKRAHILEGFRIALDNIDAIIKTIRAAQDTQTANAALQVNFKLSELQAKAILDMRLQRLTGLERQKVEDEYKEVMATIERLQAILASKQLQMQEISKELKALRDKFGDTRRTEIVHDAREFTIEDMIANEDVIVTITHQGYIKRTSVSNYRRQGRGGRGSSGANTREDDFVETVFQAATHHYLMMFTDRGRCFRVKVYDLPEGSRSSRGRSIANVIQKDNDEKITAYLPVRELNDKQFIMMTTKHGTCKKTPLNEFENVRSNGIIALGLNDDDRLVSARLTDGNCEIIIATKKGMACRFIESDVRPMGRAATGVRGINLNSGDEVVSMEAIRRSDTTMIVVGTKGYGKRSRFEDFRRTSRGAKGVISMNLTDKTGDVAAILEVNDTQDVVVMTTKGVVIRQAAKDIRVIGRNTQGVRLIKLDDEDAIADIAIVVHEEEEEGDEAALAENALAENGVNAEADADVEIVSLEGHTANGHAASDEAAPEQEDLF